MASIDAFERTHPTSGRIYLRNGLTLALFVGKHVYEISESIAAMLDAYLGMVPSGGLKWAVARATAEEWKPVDGRTIARCKAALDPAGSRKRRLTAFHLNDAAGDAPSYSFQLAGKPTDKDRPDAVTMIQMTFPLGAIEDEHLEPFVASIRALSELVPLTSGYCSPGLQFSDSDLHISQAFAEARAIALRYPGYDVERNGDTRLTLDSKVRGARWITLVGPEVAQQLGGMATLRRQLPASVAVEETRTGVMIRAGTLPEIGDVNRKIDTPALRAVARAIEAVTLFDEPRMRVYFADGDEAVLRRWERRFLSQ